MKPRIFSIIISFVWLGIAIAFNDIESRFNFAILMNQLWVIASFFMKDE